MLKVHMHGMFLCLFDFVALCICTEVSEKTDFILLYNQPRPNFAMQTASIKNHVFMLNLLELSY